MKKLFFALAMMLATVTAFLVAPSVKAETTVKIASDSSYAPFEFQNGQKKWVGIDVDIMQEVSKVSLRSSVIVIPAIIPSTCPTLRFWRAASKPGYDISNFQSSRKSKEIWLHNQNLF